MISERFIGKKSLSLLFHYNIQQYANQRFVNSFLRDIYRHFGSRASARTKRVNWSLANAPAIAVPDYSSPSLFP